MRRIALHWQILIGMVLGAVGGLVVNATLSSQSSNTPDGRIAFEDNPNRVTITYHDAAGEIQRQIIVGPPPDKKRPRPPFEVTRYETLGQLEGADATAFRQFQQNGRSKGRWIADGFNAIGGLFLQMLRMVSLPLIMTSLITGVTGLGAAADLGRMFGRTLLYYVSTSMLAIVTGLLMVNMIQPGVRDKPLEVGQPPRQAQEQGLGETLFEQIENLIPPNPFQAAAEGQFLSIIAFSLAFGIATLIVGGQHAETIRNLADAGFQVVMTLTMGIIHLAPIGVLCLMFYACATQGVDVFLTLAWYMLAVGCALTIHAAVTLPLILKFVARRSPWQFFQAMSPALITAFSSASSNATLPLTLSSVENRAGVSNRTSSFVLPLGATINMDGTALYEVVAVLFIAQMTGFPISPVQQIIIAVTALLASIGAAGIPHAGLVMMAIILQAVGLPVEAQGMILAVDRVLDMFRTSVNVWSDSCGCAVIERFELAQRPAPSPS
jgi:Na+/H+-dicarboxylate symporter